MPEPRTDDETRRTRVQRIVADKVLADPDIFTTPVGLLSDAQVAMLRAALGGPHADEIVAAMDARAAGGVSDAQCPLIFDDGTRCVLRVNHAGGTGHRRAAGGVSDA